uniref:Uncharacterized protein n=1 Tax=Arundo donax TaxID=35708 RepID=A0A0A9AW10_ARUDO
MADWQVVPRAAQVKLAAEADAAKRNSSAAAGKARRAASDGMAWW